MTFWSAMSANVSEFNGAHDDFLEVAAQCSCLTSHTTLRVISILRGVKYASVHNLGRHICTTYI